MRVNPIDPLGDPGAPATGLQAVDPLGDPGAPATGLQAVDPLGDPGAVAQAVDPLGDPGADGNDLRSEISNVDPLGDPGATPDFYKQMQINQGMQGPIAPDPWGDPGGLSVDPLGDPGAPANGFQAVDPLGDPGALVADPLGDPGERSWVERNVTGALVAGGQGIQSGAITGFASLVPGSVEKWRDQQLALLDSDIAKKKRDLATEQERQKAGMQGPRPIRFSEFIGQFIGGRTAPRETFAPTAIQDPAAAGAKLARMRSELADLETRRVGIDQSFQVAKATREAMEKDSQSGRLAIPVDESTMEHIMRVGGNAASSLGYAVAAGTMTRNPMAGAAVLGHMQGVTEYLNARKANLSVDEATRVYNLETSLATALEWLPLEMMLNPKIKSLVLKAIMQGGVESAQELADTVKTNMIAAGTYDPNRARFEGWRDAMIGGFMAGGGMTATMGAIDQAATGRATLFTQETLARAQTELVSKLGSDATAKKINDRTTDVSDAQGRTVRLQVLETADALKGGQDPEPTLRDVEAKHPEVAAQLLAKHNGNRAAAGAEAVAMFPRTAQTLPGVEVTDPDTGARVKLDVVIQLVAGETTPGVIDHETLHALAVLSGNRVANGFVVDPTTGLAIKEEDLANALEHGTNHPVRQRIRDYVLSITNLFRTNKQQSLFQTARGLLADLGKQAQADPVPDASQESALTPEAGQELQAKAQAAAMRFDERSVDRQKEGTTILLPNPRKPVTGLLDAFGRPIQGTQNLPQSDRLPGPQFQAETPNREATLRGRYQVVEADDLRTSDQTDYDQTLQPRNRDAVSSKQQIANIAMAPDPYRLMESHTTDFGAPLVDRNRQVISGNGRVLGLRQAYQGNTAEAYRQTVLKKAREMGLSEAEFIRQPILIREITDTGGSSMTDVAEWSNRPQIMQRSDAEQAEADARILTAKDLISAFAPDDIGTIRTAGNRPFLRAFVDGTGDASLLDAKGDFAPAIEARVRRAVLAAVMQGHPDSRKIIQELIEQGDALGLKRVADGVMVSGGQVLKIGQDKPDYDLRPALAQAMRDLVDFRRLTIQGTFATLPDYLAQQEMFDTGRTPESLLILQALDGSGSIKAIRELFGRYAEKVGKIDVSTGDMFGAANAPREQVLRRAYDERDTETNKAERPGRVENRRGRAAVGPSAQVESAAQDRAGTLAGVGPSEGGAKEAAYSITSRKPWPPDFPKVVIHTTRPAIQARYQADFTLAKAGNNPAAARLVRAVIKLDKIQALATRHPNAILVPVQAVEATGKNKLPRAFAEAIASQTGMAVNGDIRQANRAYHTGADGAGRLVGRAEFTGEVIPGAQYILLDDHITQGGTLGELRHYIENLGGQVVEVMALTASHGSTTLAPSSETLSALERKFGNELTGVLREFNIADNANALTESEAQLILKFRSVESVRTRLAEARDGRSRRLVQGTLPQESALEASAVRETGEQLALGMEAGNADEARGKTSTYPERPWSPEETAEQVALSYRRINAVPGQVDHPVGVSTFAERRDGARIALSTDEQRSVNQIADIIQQHNYRVDQDARDYTSEVYDEGAIPSVDRDGKFRPSSIRAYNLKFIEELDRLDPRLATRLIAEAFQPALEQSRESLALAQRALPNDIPGDLMGQVDIAGQPDPAAAYAIREKSKQDLLDILTTKNLLAPTTDIRIPGIPDSVLSQLGKPQKPLILKRNIVQKNRHNHPELQPGDDRLILAESLYNPTMLFVGKPQTRPDYWVFVKEASKNRISVVELSQLKDQYEIVGWRFSDRKALELIKKRAEREDGQFLITKDLATQGAADLSALTSSQRDTLPEDQKPVNRNENAYAIGSRKGYGRPDLSQVATSPRVRDLVAQVDQIRNQNNLPAQETMEQWDREATQRLDQDAAGEWRKFRAGELNLDDAVGTLVARKLIEREGLLVLGEGNPKAIANVAAMIHSYRSARSNIAKAMAAGRDFMETPAQRNMRLLTEAVYYPGADVEAKLEGADLETQRKILEKEAVRIQKVRSALAAKGIDLAKLSDETLADPYAVAEILRQAKTSKAGVGDMVYEYWRNSILSGIPTGVANVIGNTANIIGEYGPELWVEVAINKMMSRSRFHQDRAAQPGELRHIYRAMAGSLAAAAKNAVVAFSTEMPTMEGTRFDGNSGLAIPGMPGRIVRIPQRGLLAADEFAKTTIRHISIAQQAYRQAVADGLKGADLEARIRSALAAPSAEMERSALEEAKRLTFQSESGDTGKDFLRARGRPTLIGLGLKYLMPFITTPVNIFKTGARKYAPFGTMRLLSKAAKGEYVGAGHQAVKDLSEQIVAWAVLAAVWSMLSDRDKDGLPRITGSAPGPANKAERDFSAGKIEPRSIRLNGRWWSYARIEPLATMLTAVIDTGNMVKNPEGWDADRRFNTMWRSLLGQFSDKTYLQSIGDIVRAIEDEKRGIDVVENFAASWVPNIARITLRATDPFQRDYKVRKDMTSGLIRQSALRAWQRAIPVPGLAPDPKTDAWGRPLSARTGFGPATDVIYRMVSPVKTSKVSLNDVDRLVFNYNRKARKMEWHEKWPGLPDNRIAMPRKGKDDDGWTYYMPADEYQAFLRQRGEIVVELFNKFTFNTEDPSLGDMDRLERIITDGTEKAKSIVEKRHISDRPVRQTRTNVKALMAE